MTVKTRKTPATTKTRLKAFIYIRVSTPSQEVEEQVRIIRLYAAEHDIEITGQYGDYQKRHKADQRRSFQAMLQDMETLKPDMILVQRLDRFGTADNNELGYFITLMNKQGVKLITAIDGKNRSKNDLETSLTNAVAACQSYQEQIDKAERVLGGKRRHAILGEYLGGKYLVYGFDVVCVGRDGREKWRLVEDAWDSRTKYALNDQDEYVVVEKYGNEIVKDDNGIMPDKEIRHRPVKDTSDRLFYSPSIRQERLDTLRRICEWFNAGWTTYRIAQQLNTEKNRPVYSDHWYPTHIDGLLENAVLVGKPAWNRTSQSHFRHIKGDRVVETDEDQKGVYRHNVTEEWVQPGKSIFGFIDPDLFQSIQEKLEERRASTPKRSPRSEELWLGGLWWDEDSDTKLAGNSQGKHFRVKHPEHEHKRITFKEAEWFIGEYLRRVGERLDTLGEAVEDNKVLERLAHEEWMKELHLEYIVLEIQSYLEKRLKPGMNRVGGVDVILDYDHERNAVLFTEGNYLELYCKMVKDDMENNQSAVQALMDERRRLTEDLMNLRRQQPHLDQYVLDSYNEQITRLSQQIEAATAAPDFMAWWEQVQEEIELLRQRQTQVNEAIKCGSYVQKANAIRSMIERITCHWATEPTKDKRYKTGFKTYCRAVTITPKEAARDRAGQPIETMTIETSSA